MATISLKLSDGSTLPIATAAADVTPASGTTKFDLTYMNTHKLYFLDKGSYLAVKCGFKRLCYMEKTFANQKFLNTFVISFNEEDGKVQMIPRNTSKMCDFSEAFNSIGFVYPFTTMTAADVDSVLQNNANIYIYPRLQDSLPVDWAVVTA
jgi:hypothetical protein